MKPTSKVHSHEYQGQGEASDRRVCMHTYCKLEGYLAELANCWLHSLLRVVKVKKHRECKFSYL